MAQERYWKELFQLKFHIYYVESHIHNAKKYDQRINIFMAATSSTSIGLWAIWKEWSFLWAMIIALSQVVAAIRPHLPFKTRLKIYSSMLREFEELFILAEAEWHEISLGKLVENDINKARTNLQMQKNKILKKHSPSSMIPDDTEMAEKAEKLALSYFQMFYPT